MEPISYLILSLHIQHVLHIQLERVCAPRANHARAFVNFEPPSRAVPHDKVVDVVVRVWVPGLQREDRGVGSSV